MYQYLACGLDNVLLENGYVVQSVDGEEHVSIDALDSLHMAIGLHLVNTSRSLNGKKIRFLRIEKFPERMMRVCVICILSL